MVPLRLFESLILVEDAGVRLDIFFDTDIASPALSLIVCGALEEDTGTFIGLFHESAAATHRCPRKTLPTVAPCIDVTLWSGRHWLIERAGIIRKESIAQSEATDGTIKELT